MLTQPKRLQALPEGAAPELDLNDQALFWEFADETLPKDMLDILKADLGPLFAEKRNPTGRALSLNQLHNLGEGASKMLIGLVLSTSRNLNQRVYRSSAPRKYQNYEGVNFKTFEGCIHAFCGLGFIECHKPTHQRRVATSRGTMQAGVSAMRYSMKPELLEYLQKLGINPTDPNDSNLMLPPLSIRASKETNGAGERSAKKLSQDIYRLLKDTQSYTRCLEELEEINGFISKQNYGGQLERAPSLRRIFHGAEKSEFDFNYGGRLYAQNGSYQTWKKHDGLSASRVRVGNITINGEAVVGLDVHASFPFLAEYLLQYTPDDVSRRDYYDIPELAAMIQASPERARKAARDAAKAVCVAVFGKGSMPRRFNPKDREKFPELTLSAPNVFEIVAKHRETIRNFASDQTYFDWGHLHYLESEAFITAIKELMRQDIPSLPVHDELIVPATKEAQGRRAILRGYERFRVGGELPLIKATKVA